MSLFLDEKTKEAKSQDYLAGWNECEKHVRESTIVGFDEWLPSSDVVCKGAKEDLLKTWQACSIMKDKEIAEKELEVQHIKKWWNQALQKPMPRAGAQVCLPNPIDLIEQGREDIRFLREKIQSLESQLQHSKEWFSEAEERIKLLESQLKERDEALIEMAHRLDSVSDQCDVAVTYKSVCHSNSEEADKLLKKHQSLINQIKESRK